MHKCFKCDETYDKWICRCKKCNTPIDLYQFKDEEDYAKFKKEFGWYGCLYHVPPPHVFFEWSPEKQLRNRASSRYSKIHRHKYGVATLIITYVILILVYANLYFKGADMAAVNTFYVFLFPANLISFYRVYSFRCWEWTDSKSKNEEIQQNTNQSSSRNYLTSQEVGRAQDAARQIDSYNRSHGTNIERSAGTAFIGNSDRSYLTASERGRIDYTLSRTSKKSK